MTDLNPLDAYARAAGAPADELVDPFADDHSESLDHLIRTATQAITEVKARQNQQDNDDEFELHESWEPVDLSVALAGGYEQPQPDHLIRDDGRALFYPGSVNGIHGDSGTGKGWIEVFLVVECARRGRRCVLYDFEDNEGSWTSRLIIAGLTSQQILDTLIYIRPEVPFGPLAVEHACERIREADAAVTIIDSLGEAFATEGLDENKDVEVGPWLRRVARPMAETGTALVLVDHSTKAGDNPLYPSGSKRKRAAMTGASYLVEALTPFVKPGGTGTGGGRLRLTCAKDRHGNYRKGEVVGDFVMRYSAHGRQSLQLASPSIAEASNEPATVPAILAARAAVKAAKSEGDQLSQTALIGLMSIKCRNDMKKGGIDLAVARGALTETIGKQRARLFEYAADFPEGAES